MTTDDVTLNRPRLTTTDEVAAIMALVQRWRWHRSVINAPRDVETYQIEAAVRALGEERDRYKAEAERLREMLESVLPLPADHAPSGIDGWVQCSLHESGHEYDDCPQDLDDDALVGIVLGDVRAVLRIINRARNEAQTDAEQEAR